MFYNGIVVASESVYGLAKFELTIGICNGVGVCTRAGICIKVGICINVCIRIGVL